MVNPILYDFRRTITSKTILITIAMIIIISLAIIPVVKSFASPVPQLGAGTSEVLEYHNSSGYHFFGYSFNIYGQPINGATYSATITGSSGKSSVNPITNSSGEVAFLLLGPPGQSQLSLTISYGASPSQTTLSETLPQSATGKPVSLTGNDFVPVVDSVNGSKVDLLVTYEGISGSSPTAYSVYYAANSTTVSGFAVPSTPTEAGMTLLGQLGSYHKIFTLPSFNNQTQSLEFAIFMPNGTAIDAVQLPISDFRATSVTLQAGSIFAAFTAAILAIVVPLMAVLVAYGSYGKDRVSGVLESVLSRPVSRRGLSISRYLSIVLGLSLAIGIAVVVTSSIALVLIGSFSGLLEFTGYTFLSLVVEAAAFVGLVLLLSHIVRSTGALIGLAVTIWVLLDFFWGTIIFAISSALGYGAGSASYLAVSIESDFFNPAQFYLLVGDYLNKTFISTTGGSSLPISPATYGLTPVTLIAAGVLWVVVPFAIFLRLATSRD